MKFVLSLAVLATVALAARPLQRRSLRSPAKREVFWTGDDHKGNLGQLFWGMGIGSFTYTGCNEPDFTVGSHAHCNGVGRRRAPFSSRQVCQETEAEDKAGNIIVSNAPIFPDRPKLREFTWQTVLNGATPMRVKDVFDVTDAESKLLGGGTFKVIDRDRLGDHQGTPFWPLAEALMSGELDGAIDDFQKVHGPLRPLEVLDVTLPPCGIEKRERSQNDKRQSAVCDLFCPMGILILPDCTCA